MEVIAHDPQRILLEQYPPTFPQEEKRRLRTEGATLSDGGKFGGGGSRPGPRDRIPRTCMTPRRRARKRRAREDQVAKTRRVRFRHKEIDMEEKFWCYLMNSTKFCSAGSGLCCASCVEENWCQKKCLNSPNRCGYSRTTPHQQRKDSIDGSV